MDEIDVLKRADIIGDGSILLGKHTVCDGARRGRRIAVFTHIHRDHTGLFDMAIQECSHVFMTRPTLEMMYALKNRDMGVSPECYFGGRHVRALDYGEPVRPKLDPFSPGSAYGDRITLFPSQHMLGSCQVLVVEDDGTRIAYTGDFAAGADPVACDILVLDSTHGTPTFDTSADRGSLERRLVEYVDEELQRGRNVVIRSHRGRLQYTMHLLHGALPEQVRFLAHPNDIAIAQVYRKHGMAIRDCINYNSAAGIQTWRSGHIPCIEFRSHGPDTRALDEVAVFNLGGRTLGGGTVIKTNGEYGMEFMDHADYASILAYVKKVSPRYVVTDYARGRQGAKLAEAIRGTGISAIARPTG